MELGDDQPKQNPWQEDRLGYAPFAQRLAKIVINMQVPNGYVIGLHGRWGSGKTTLVNFVVEHIRKYNQELEDDKVEIEHIDFRPWIVSGHQDLMSAFFKLLSEHLGTKEKGILLRLKKSLNFLSNSTDQLIDAAATLAISVDPSGGTVSKVARVVMKKSVSSLLSNYLEEPSLQKAYENLKCQLSTSGRRFFVTIDDIDRLEDSEIKAIMQLVKTVGRLPNVTYLLAYDREIVWQALDERVNRIGPKFAEKIVQQEVELPRPSKNALLSILDKEINFLTGSTEDSTRWHFIVQNGVHRWINQPRDVVRLSNALKFAWPALIGEFDAHDLVAAEGIRLFDSEAFEWIRNNRDFLFNEGRYFIGAEDERKANIEALKKTLPSGASESILSLLAILFSNQAKWFQSATLVSDEAHHTAQNRRGFASDAGYDSYFALHPTTDAVSKTFLNSIIDNLDDETKLTQSLSAYLGRSNSRGKSMTGLLLRDLRYRFSEHPRPDPTQALLNAVLSIGEEVYRVPLDGEAFGLNPSSTFTFLVKDFLKIWKEDDAGKYLLEAYKNSNSPFILSDLYVDRGRELGIFPANDPSQNFITKEDFNKLGDILLPKINLAAKNGSLEQAPFYYDIVRTWNYLDSGDMALNWLIGGVENSGFFTAKVVKGLVNQSYSTSGTRYIFREIPDEDFYEIDFIYENAKRHLSDEKNLTEDDRSLLEAIVNGVDRMRAGKSPDPFLDGE